MFKDYLWFLNENNTEDNRIVFDKNLKEFDIEDIVLSHENQRIELLGSIGGANYKDLKLSFKDVSIYSFTKLAQYISCAAQSGTARGSTFDNI